VLSIFKMVKLLSKIQVKTSCILLKKLCSIDCDKPHVFRKVLVDCRLSIPDRYLHPLWCCSSLYLFQGWGWSLACLNKTFQIQSLDGNYNTYNVYLLASDPELSGLGGEDWKLRTQESSYDQVRMWLSLSQKYFPTENVIMSKRLT
jgi:hypothetical protein